MGPHRIFQAEWAHRLQVRYPWFGGYASAPLAFAAGRKYADTGLTLLSNITPLLTSGDKSAAAIAAQGLSAQALFTLHFVRRALEVVFVNDYTGTFARDSRLELLYYILWGLIAGAAAGTAPMMKHGVAPRLVRTLGACLFVLGQVGNAWCHWELRRLRTEKQALGSSKYFMPTRGPFCYISSPHYTFELVTWLGFCVHNGLDVTGALLWLMSIGAMGAFARDRHAKYLALWKGGQREGVDPATKWIMVPGVW
eukprot:jgi/Chrpa1/17835/Chrysochromulina_OHIO_Genome00023531-RA